MMTFDLCLAAVILKEEKCRLSQNKRALTYRHRNLEKVRVDQLAHYHKNKTRLLADQRAKRRERYEFFNEMKTKPCMDCGQSFDPVCMDWDHVRGVKSFAISKTVSRPMDVMLAEIAKCDLVCSNCHRLRTKNRKRGQSHG